MCYRLDIFTRSASVYKIKIRKTLNGPLVKSLVYTPVHKNLYPGLKSNISQSFDQIKMMTINSFFKKKTLVQFKVNLTSRIPEQYLK